MFDNLPHFTATQIASRPVIEFKADYPKLHGQKSAYLMAVEPITIDGNTPRTLIEYYTTKSDGTKYQLRQGEAIQLFFVGNDRIPFCAIRRRFLCKLDGSGEKVDKLEFFKRKIGQIFNIKFEAGNNGH